MKQKTLGRLAFSLPMAAITAASIGNVANAAVFSNEDTLSYSIVANVENLVLFPDAGSPSAFIDFQAPANAPGSNTLAPANISGVPGSNISAMPTGFSSCNTGGLNSTACLADPTLPADNMGNFGGIRDFNVDQFPPLTADLGIIDTNGANSFLTILNSATNSSWYFGLDTTTVRNPNFPGSSVFTPVVETVNGFNCGPGSLAPGCSVSLDFVANGKVQDKATGEIAHVEYFYSVTGIELVEGDGTNVSPFTTDTRTASGSLEIAVKAVPESGTFTSLLTLGVMGFLGILRREIKK